MLVVPLDRGNLKIEGEGDHVVVWWTIHDKCHARAFVTELERQRFTTRIARRKEFHSYTFYIKK